jgi:hypothetical protein
VHRGQDVCRVSHVAFNERARHAAEPLPVTAAQVVKDPYLMTFPGQAADEAAPEEPGPTGHEDSHATTLADFLIILEQT